MGMGVAQHTQSIAVNYCDCRMLHCSPVALHNEVYEYQLHEAVCFAQSLLVTS